MAVVLVSIIYPSPICLFIDAAQVFSLQQPCFHASFANKVSQLHRDILTFKLKKKNKWQNSKRRLLEPKKKKKTTPPGNHNL